MTIPIASALPATLRRPTLGSLFVALALCACGGSDATDPPPNPTPPPAVQKNHLTLVAGSLGGPGNLDGAGAAARFTGPQDVAVNATGDVYVADTLNRRIRKITPEGVVSTVAGSGEFKAGDGPAMQASFCSPTKIAVGPDASLLVIDQKMVRKIDAAGNVRTVVGAAVGLVMENCSSGAGNTNDKAVLKRPNAIAVDALGIAYIGDDFSGAIYTLTPAGVLTLLAGSEDERNPGTALAFTPSSGIALDAERNLYVAGAYTLPADNNGRGTYSIVRISQAGDITTALSSQNPMSALARDAAGNFYVMDGSTGPSVLKFTPDGRRSVLVQGDGIPRFEGGVDGPPGTGQLGVASSFAVAADGSALYVPDLNAVRKVSPATGMLSTLAGLNAPNSPDLGTHTTDSAGHVFLAVRKPRPYGYRIDRIAPGADAAPLADLGADTPVSMVTDRAGNLFVLSHGSTYDLDGLQGTSVVRKITPQGAVSVFAGNPSNKPLDAPPVGVDGTGTAAVLTSALAMAIDPADNLWVAQVHGAPLRKITPQGVVSTLAASMPSARQFPNAAAADAAGNVYLVSCAKPGYGQPASAAILKVDLRGAVTELAGSLAEAGYADGPGAQARFAAAHRLGRVRPYAGTCPSGLALDAAGNVHVADTGNSAVRKVTPQGVVSTVVGQKGVRGSAEGPLPASLFEPTGVSFDGAGILYIHSATGSGPGAMMKVRLAD